MIDEIVTQLQTSSLAQVLRPDAVGATSINGGVVVADLITSYVSGRVYNLSLPQDEVLPNAVFQLVGSKRDDVDGLPVVRTETVILTVRDSTLDGLNTVGNSIRSALLGYASAGNAGAITIDDEAEDVEDEGNGRRYRMHFELTITHLATSDQSLPAAFVYPLSCQALDPELVNSRRQRVINTVAVAIVEKSTGGSMETARGYAEDLIGHTINGWPVEYSGGELLRQDGHLTTWRERFTLQSFKANT